MVTYNMIGLLRKSNKNFTHFPPTECVSTISVDLNAHCKLPIYVWCTLTVCKHPLPLWIWRIVDMTYSNIPSLP